MGKIIIHLHLVWNKIRASWFIFSQLGKISLFLRSGIVPVINVLEDDVNNRFYKCLVDMKNFMKKHRHKFKWKFDSTLIFYNTHWMQDVKWTCIRHLEIVQDVTWTPLYMRPFLLLTVLLVLTLLMLNGTDNEI